jgi:hypothetical protein
MTVSSSHSVMNDFNAGQYSLTSLRISGIKVTIDSNVFEFGEISIAFTNGFIPPHNYWANESHVKYIPWNPIMIFQNTTELIVTLSMDIEDIFDDQSNTLIDKWWERIKLETSVQ